MSYSFIKIFIVVIISVFFIGESRAEGGCPPGYYPIGGQGVVGCAPIPGSQNNAAAPALAPEPAGRWIKRWGAIAGDESLGIYGASAGRYSLSLAEREAEQNCIFDGGVDCKIIFSYHNQCVGMSEPKAGGENVSIQYASGPHKSGAERLAISNCEKKNRAACKITYSACSEPIFIEN